MCCYNGQVTDEKPLSGKGAVGLLKRYVRDDLLEHFHKSDPANLYRIREFRDIENFYGHLRSLQKVEFPTAHDYELYMRDVLNVFDYYVRTKRLSKRLAFWHADKWLRQHWRDGEAVYSTESFQELL